MQYLVTFTQVFVILTLLAFGLKYGNRRLVKYFEGRPHLKIRQQLIQIGGALFVVLLLILLMPLGDDLRGNLLGFYGIIVSATIALSSTTLVGNILAGIMLKAIGSCRPGNYITVGEHFGRISEMDLLHTEIQTEERDLTTLPNLYLVTNPVRVMRKSGAMLYVELSLGYDVSRHRVEDLLVQAAKDTGLESPFVQIRNLGDYSVTYRVSGVLKESNRLLEKRRELRGKTMDALHEAEIEIVSPTFMNTRSLKKDQTFIAKGGELPATRASAKTPDSVVFDKAEKAQSVEKLRETLDELHAQLKSLHEAAAETTDERTTEAARSDIDFLEQRVERIKALIERKEAKIAKE